MKKLTFLAVFSISLWAYSCDTAPKAELFSVMMDQTIDLMEINQAMGIFAVERDGTQIYSKSIGMSDLSSQKAITDASLFRLMDISDAMTAVMIYRLVDASRLSLSDNLTQYGFSFTNAGKITINHLLQHTSGVNDLTKSSDFATYKTTALQREALDAKLNASGAGPQVPLITPNYNCTNFILLSRIIEKATQQSYTYVFDSLIKKPLNLSDLYVESADASVSRTTPYDDNKQALAGEINAEILLGAGAVVSTAKDLNRFFSQLFNNRDFLSAQYLDSLKKSSKGINVVGVKSNESDMAEATKFGHGVFEFAVMGRLGYGSLGSMGQGYKTMVMYFPDKKVSLCFLLNYLKSTIEQEDLVDNYLNIYFSNTN